MATQYSSSDSSESPFMSNFVMEKSESYLPKNYKRKPSVTFFTKTFKQKTLQKEFATLLDVLGRMVATQQANVNRKSWTYSLRDHWEIKRMKKNMIQYAQVLIARYCENKSQTYQCIMLDTFKLMLEEY